MTQHSGLWHQPGMLLPPPTDRAPQHAAGRERLLVVEDDTEIAALIADMLTERGYEVLRATDGRDLERLLHREQIDLVILDLMLPGEDGLSLCRRLRARTGVPMLMLTAIGADADRIIGLESGADDYMVKPFAPRELLARVRALLRRTGGTTLAPVGSEIAAYQFNGWELNLLRMSLVAPGGAVVTLTGGEFSLLTALCGRAGQVVSRETLLLRNDNPQPAAFDRSIDTLVGRLRRKLQAHVAVDDVNGELIRTVRNAGYVFTPQVVVQFR